MSRPKKVWPIPKKWRPRPKSEKCKHRNSKYGGDSRLYCYDCNTYLEDNPDEQLTSNTTSPDC